MVAVVDDADSNNASCSISRSRNCPTDAETTVMDDFDFELLLVVVGGCGNSNNILTH